MRKRNVCGFIVLLMAVMGVAGALAWGNRPHAARKAKTPKSAAPPVGQRPPLLPLSSSLTASRAKRQTIIHTIDIVPGVDGRSPRGVDVNPNMNRIYTANELSNTVSVIDAVTHTLLDTVNVGVSPLSLAVNPSTGRIYVSNNGSNTVSVIEAGTNAVIATINVGGAPNQIAINKATNRIYVGNFSDNTVSVIDGATNTVVTTIGVGNGPMGVAVNETTNLVYVTNFNDNTMTVIDGSDNTVMATTIGVGITPNAVAVNPVTNRIYVTNQDADSVTVVDGTNNQVIGTAAVGDAPFGMVVNSTTNHIYVANRDSDDVSVIDGATNTEVARVAVGNAPMGVAVEVANNRIYAANFNSHTVTVIDGASNTVLAVAMIRSEPRDVTVNPSTNKVYVTDQTAFAVNVIDATTNTVEATVPVGRLPYAAAVNPATNKIYVTNMDSNSVSVINGATNQVMRTIPVGAAPTGVAVNPNTNRIYVADRFSNQVSVIDGVTDSRLTTVNVGSEPYGVAVNSSTNRIYVSNFQNNTVSVIDGTSHTVMTTVPVGSGPSGVAVNSMTNRIYVANSNDNTVSVIDGTSNTVTAIVAVGANPEAVGANNLLNKVYVANANGNSVSVIDGTSNTVMATVATNQRPFGIGVNANTSLVYTGSNGTGTVQVIHDPLSGNSATVTNTNDSGPGSLRQALIEANNVPGTTIVFRIPLNDPGFNNMAGVFIIRPISPLPIISGNGTVIDGVSQTIFTGDTNPMGPEIVINGDLAGASAIGLHIQNAANCLIKDLIINGFSSSGISINGTGATNNRVDACFIGTNEKGDAAVPNGIDGIVITDGASNNIIGGDLESLGNLISGNGQNGIVIAGAGVTGNRVCGNTIGLNLVGDAAIGNARNGILIINGAHDNVVGGMTFQVDGNVISGNSEDGVHISGTGTDNNLVRNSCIGGDWNCAAKIPNGGDGVEIAGGAMGNVIGDAANDLGNAIFGNGGNGVLISDNNTTLNKVQRCAIGTNPNNAAGVGNVLNGVHITNGAHNNLIGGPETNQGCVISGNGQNGVRITQASGNAVQGSFIGTNIGGTASLPNAQHGVLMDSGASNNQIGGATAGARNVISGNGAQGVLLSGIDVNGNQVLGNFIGTNLAGTAAIPNTDSGVAIDRGQNNVVGGTTAGERNVIAGNGRDGVEIGGNVATGNRIQGNFIGTDVNGTTALPNTNNGVRIFDAPQNFIGGATPQEQNVISGNDTNGVLIDGANAMNNQVQGNFIGTDRSGTGALGNRAVGVFISSGASNNLIGGMTAGARNVISGNIRGVSIVGNTTTGNVVQGNFIGTDVTGTTDLGNSQKGVHIGFSANNNLIGGMTAGAGNLISGNDEVGVELIGGASNNTVQGNLIGTDRNGTSPLGNASGVTMLSAGNNVIGGATPGAGNVISGNSGRGVTIASTGANNNRVQGNFIGTDKNGTADLGNADDGVHVANASNNLIGGGNAGEGNVICGNDANGVHILGNGTSNTVQGNFIGTDVNGVAALGNDDNGVLIDESSQNVIGGVTASDGNRIAHNALDGVRITNAAATQNRILSNLIHDNGGLGINLVGGVENVFGVTDNDPSDADGSPNKLQNFPVLTLAATDGNFTTINGSLDSDPANAAYPLLIQFFISNAADPSGFGEGKELFASHVLSAPGNFSLNNLPSVPVGTILTATATDRDGNTSEFSQAMPVSMMSLGVAHLSIGATPSVVGVDGKSVIEVRATNDLGDAVSNTNIVFQTTGGQLNASTDTTDANGMAQVILSQIPFGATTVTAEAGNVRVTVEVKGVLRIGVPAGVSLLSFPVDVAAGQVGAVFRGGRVDVAQWMPSLSTSLGHYEFFSQQPFDLNAGRGYWVNSDVAQMVEISNGALPDPQQPALIAFERDTPGWDLRGNPSVRDLLFDISRINVLENGVAIGTLADILRDGKEEEPIVEPYCWKWTNDAVGAGYELVIDPRLLLVLAIPPDIGRAIADNHLEFGRGAFFFLRRRNLALEFPPELQVTHASRAQRTQREPVKPSVDNWTIGLQAQAGNIKTGDSVIGVSEKIENDLQVKKSPPVTSQQFVDLSLLNEKNELAWDVRAARTPKMTWDVLVTTNQTGTVSLTYTNLSRLPKNLRAYVVDPDSGKRQFMRTTTRYAFTVNGSGITQKRLRIEVTSEADGKLLVNGLQATVGGSGAGQVVRLSFVLNREAMVRGRVLSPTGKIIRAMTPVPAQRGLNVVSWDGKTQRGGVAGRGVYVMELVAEDGEGEQVRAVRLVTLR